MHHTRIYHLSLATLFLWYTCLHTMEVEEYHENSSLEAIPHSSRIYQLPRSARNIIVGPSIVDNVSCSPTHIAYGNNLENIYVAERENDSFTRLPSKISRAIDSMCFTKDGTELVIGCYNEGVAQRWNFLSKQWENPLIIPNSMHYRTHIHLFNTLSPHPINEYEIASGSEKGILCTWDLNRASIIQKRHLEGKVKKVTYGSSGNTLAILLNAVDNRKTTVALWDLRTSKISLGHYTTDQCGHSRELAYSLDESSLAFLIHDTMFAWGHTSDAVSACSTHGKTNTLFTKTFTDDIALNTLFFANNTTLIGLGRQTRIGLGKQQMYSFFTKTNDTVHVPVEVSGHTTWHNETRELSMCEYVTQDNQLALKIGFYDFSQYSSSTPMDAEHIEKPLIAQIGRSFFHASQRVHTELSNNKASDRLVSAFVNTLAVQDHFAIPSHAYGCNDYYDVYVDKALRTALLSYLTLKSHEALKKIHTKYKIMKEILTNEIYTNVDTLTERILNRDLAINFAFWCDGKKVAETLLDSVGECPICFEACKDLMVHGRTGESLQSRCGHMLCRFCWKKMESPEGYCRLCPLCRNPFTLTRASLGKLQSKHS
jgi:hypothetical protein